MPERVRTAGRRNSVTAPRRRSGAGAKTVKAPSHSPIIENAEVARLFREMADLLELENANPFRVRAYRTASRTIEELPEPVVDIARREEDGLSDLPGIGADLADKIREMIRHGSFDALERFRRKVPPGLLGLIRIRGLGPKRARVLRKALKIESVEDLKWALIAGRVSKVPGFGSLSEEKLKRELALQTATEARVLRPVAAQYWSELVRYLRAVPGVEQVEIAGSFRRKRETVGDLDVLVAARSGTPIAERLAHYPEVEQILTQGSRGTSIRLRSGLQVDVRFLPAVSFGAGLVYFTGSKPHNIALRRLGQRRGLKINEYGVFKAGKRVAGRTEEEVYAKVGLPWIPPELREDRGELDAARRGVLPDLVTLEEIRGDLQMHTTGSDGRNDLAAMARAAQELRYEYIAVTDHSPAMRMVQGLDAAGFRRQGKRIDQLNARSRSFTILKGAEVDIGADGALDLDDATLAALDVVVASIHSHFDLSEQAQTRRIVRALQHPCVDIFGHPTGRLLGERRGIRADWAAIFRAAADHGVMVEINAQPSRLDLDDVQARAAVEAGVRLVIDTDAHSTAELKFMQWGIDQARRGWVSRANVANTYPLSTFRRWLHGNR